MEPFMNQNPLGRQCLSDSACTVAATYLNQSWDHPQAAGLPLAWRGLLKELRFHCPGFTDLEYGIALNRAFSQIPVATSSADSDHRLFSHH
jgi:hypothetical protein